MRLAVLLFATLAVSAQEAEWTRLLRAYYSPTHGLDYAALKARDAKSLQSLRQQLGQVDVKKLDRKSQLAHWINVYNVNTVATIVEHYPVESIRDISTDPLIRLNVFKKDRVPVGATKVSLDHVEHEIIRKEFRDPRIHFAINCAAKSCPPMRAEAFTGARLDAQLDEQARAFLATTRFHRDGKRLVITTSKILDWFGDDFEEWGGGKVAFIRRYVSPDKQRLIDAAKGDVRIEYEDYDWALNDWKRP